MDSHPGKVLKIIQAHQESVSSVAYNREGTIFVSGSYDGTWYWDPFTHQPNLIISAYSANFGTQRAVS